MQTGIATKITSHHHFYFLFQNWRVLESLHLLPSSRPLPAYCCFPGFGNCTSKLSGAAAARASRGASGGACAAAEAKDRKQEDRWRRKEGTASVRGADQRLLRSSDPWRYGPCQGLLIRTRFATCRSPGGTVCVRGRSASCWEAPTAQLQGVRSLSGANQRPLAKCRLQRRPPGGTVRVRGRSASSCQVPTPWRYGPCQGADYHFSCQVPTPGAYGPCEGQWASSCEVREPWEIRSLSGAD